MSSLRVNVWKIFVYEDVKSREWTNMIGLDLPLHPFSLLGFAALTSSVGAALSSTFPGSAPSAGGSEAAASGAASPSAFGVASSVPAASSVSTFASSPDALATSAGCSSAGGVVAPGDSVRFRLVNVTPQVTFPSTMFVYQSQRTYPQALMSLSFHLESSWAPLP